MTNPEFRKYAHKLADWMADYMENIKEILKNNYGIIENSAGKKTAIRLKDWFEI